MGELLGLLRWPVTPLWIMALAFIVALWRGGPDFMARWNERQRDRAAIENDQFRLLADRCTVLETAEMNCRRDLNDALRRLADLEGWNEGQGRARQDAQRMLSAGREADAAKRGE